MARGSSTSCHSSRESAVQWPHTHRLKPPSMSIRQGLLSFSLPLVPLQRRRPVDRRRKRERRGKERRERAPLAVVVFQSGGSGWRQCHFTTGACRRNSGRGVQKKFCIMNCWLLHKRQCRRYPNRQRRRKGKGNSKTIEKTILTQRGRRARRCRGSPRTALCCKGTARIAQAAAMHRQWNP